MKNALEELLYTESSFARMKEASKQERRQHPYLYGMYLSINHNAKNESEIIRQYEKIYRIVYSTLTRRVLNPKEVITKESLIREKEVKALLRRNIPLMTSSIHKFEAKTKKYSDGRRSQGFYYHSHHHFYRISNLLPKSSTEMIDVVSDLRIHLQQYIPTTNQRHLLVKVQPTGTGGNINDRINDSSYYEYLKTDPTTDKRNLLNYFQSQSPLQCDSSLRFTFTI